MQSTANEADEEFNFGFDIVWAAAFDNLITQQSTTNGDYQSEKMRIYSIFVEINSGKKFEDMIKLC